MPKKSQERTTESTQSVVGTRNDEFLTRRNAIAESADEIVSGDLEDVPEEGAPKDEPEEVEAPPEQVEGAQDESDAGDEAAEEVEPAKPEAKKYRLKVNGQDREFTEAEILERASKVEAADEYLRQAAELNRKAGQPSKDAAPKEDEDLPALARAIQMGSEEEAVQALRKLRARPSATDDVDRVIDGKLAFREAATWVQSEYADIMGSKVFRAAFLAEDSRLLNEGDSRPYKARYKEIGDGIRKELGLLKSSVSQDQKQARKATVTPIRAASGRAVEVENDQEPDDDRSIIANMAKTRGQKIA